MDYLALFEGTGAKHLRVPFLATKKLRADELFSDFGRQPFPSYRTTQSHQTECQLGDILQSWLYVGMLAEIFGEELDPAEVKSANEQEPPYVELGDLRKRIAELVVSGLKHGTDTYRDRSTSPTVDLESGVHESIASPSRPRRLHTLTFNDCLRRCEDELSAFEPYTKRLNSPVVDLVVLSIEVLLSSLGRIRYCQMKSLDQDMSPSARHLKLCLVKQGWCVRECRSLFRLYDLGTLYSFAMLPRRTRPTITHSVCTETVCTAWKSSISSLPTVATLHVAEDCACELVGVSTAKLVSLIQRQRIPLVSITRDQRGKLSIELEEWDGLTPYTAISHVWADGLGNTHSNQLPACQITRLERMMLDVPTKYRLSGFDPLVRLLMGRKNWFWMDTFCIPPVHDGQSPEERDTCYRAKVWALNLMDGIYTLAMPTLVLDAEIQSLSREMHPATIMAYVSHCGWTTRAWTLQEGGLSRRVVFALRDGAFEVVASPSTELAHRSRRDSTISLAGTVDYKDIFHRDWSRHRSLVVGSGTREEWEPETLHVIWNGLVGRHTTFQQDLVAILANLLGYQSSDVLESRQPLACLIRSLYHVPVAFIFNVASSGDRTPSQPSSHTEPALLTASTLQNIPKTVLNRWIPTEICSNLILNGPAFRRHGSVLILKHADAQRHYTMFLSRRTKSLPQQFRLRDPRDTGVLSTEVEALWGAEDLHDLRIIESVTIGFCFIFEVPSERFKSRSYGGRGAALAIVEENERTIKTIFYCSLLAYTRNSSHHSAFLSSPEIACSYTIPSQIELSYDPDALTPARRTQPVQAPVSSATLDRIWPTPFSYVFQDSKTIQPYMTSLDSLRNILGSLPAIVLVGFSFLFSVVSTAIEFLPKEGTSDPANPKYWPHFVGLLVCVVPYTLAIWCCQSWAYNHRVMRRCSLDVTRDVKSRIAQRIKIVVDYAVNSRLVVLVVYNVMAITWTVIYYGIVSRHKIILFTFLGLSILPAGIFLILEGNLF